MSLETFSEPASDFAKSFSLSDILAQFFLTFTNSIKTYCLELFQISLSNVDKLKAVGFYLSDESLFSLTILLKTSQQSPQAELQNIPNLVERRNWS